MQVLAAMLWMEGAKYASHRWHHRSRALWWLHALHHSSRRLYSLNNFRFHPLNHAINQLVSIGPLLMLGVPADVLLAGHPNIVESSNRRARAAPANQAEGR